MNSARSVSSPGRRALLKGLVAAGAIAALPRRVVARASDGRAAILRYLAAHRRSDHGYGFEDQARSHLTPTFAVIGCHRLLEEMPPNRDALCGFLRANHPRELQRQQRERRHFDYQQIQSLVWLGDEAADFRERIRPQIVPRPYPKISERHGYPVFQSELAGVQCHALLGLPVARLAPAFADYVTSRRRANGSFNNTPVADGGDGHVMNTLWGLQAQRTLRIPDENPAGTAAWLRAAQLPGGGFTFQPEPAFGGVDDVAYTRAAVRALQLVGAEPAGRQSCIAWLLSLANADGGFGDRPGWRSNPMATYLALDALEALGALAAIETLAPARRRAPPARVSLPPGLKVFSLQLEAHGTGSPADAVELAAALRIDLWGAKLARPGWLAAARARAAERNVPVRFFASDEEHGCWMDVPGLGTYSHMSDVFAPAGSDFGPPVGLDRATARAVSWEEFRRRRLTPLERARGRLLWQAGSNEELVRIFLDDSLERGGYAAISTYHFGNPDLMNTEPFLQRWRGRIPYVALQDAHGTEPWWFADFTAGFRTLFLATDPTWEGWLRALERNWTAAVRHDGVTKGTTWMHGGSDEVLELVRSREAEWRWWDNPRCVRPLVSIVPVRPDDEFEDGRPESGVTIRVRCAWQSSYVGALQKPLAELVRLSVDGREVSPTLVERKGTNTRSGDHAHHYTLTGAAAGGKHRVTAVVREIATGKEITRTVLIG